MSKKQGEFKLLYDSTANVQKWLNQWRHNYTLVFHHIEVLPNCEYTFIMLERIERDNPGN